MSRAWNVSGHERHTVLLIAKSALAATVAWWVAHDLLRAASAAFAPFSAVLTMQVTIHRSVWQSLRYIAAVVAGVALQAGIGLLVGPDLLAFVVTALVALVLGQWRALGEQRAQVGTAAFFAFSTYVSSSAHGDRAAALGQIVLLVLVGCGIGLVVNLGIAPPLRLRSADQGLRLLATEMEALLDDMAEHLDSGDLDADRAEQWRTAGARLEQAVVQARAGLDTAESSVPFNPRRLLPAHRGRLAFDRHRQVLGALERAVHQLGSLTRSLSQWRDTEHTFTYAPTLRAYADFARRLRDIARALAALDGETPGGGAPEMRRSAVLAQRALQRLLDCAGTYELPLADSSRPYGVLVVEATRLMEEFQNTCDVLQGTADR
ncbi:hypothetical protein H9Y04_11265 [Streptomyces sp. TRM66268-LWL]|uniref:FUSC family protein n=1 Tax=Streptomyces polyasparticus TaxID=2767826 RepID=A0ABR7SD99_9ACTN|nr:hypothetical protein [Streptomyces polyasparticus]